MAKRSTLEVCNEHLFSSVEIMQKNAISPQMIDRVKRIRSAYTVWLDTPLKKDKEIRDLIMRQFGVSQSEAYEDIKIIKQLLGQFSIASKDWHRLRFNTMIQKAYERAELKGNSMAMSIAADKYAKYNQLHIAEGDQLPFDMIVPQVFVPTSDPSVLGIKPVDNIHDKIAALKKKYESEIEDVNYVDVGYDVQLFNDVSNGE